MTTLPIPASGLPTSSRLAPPAPWEAGLAIFQREMTTLWRNRFLLVFCALALAAGLGAVFFTRHAASIPYVLLQSMLYLMPLFAILTAVSSAHGEAEEQALLLSQPFPREMLVWGKWLALAVSFTVGIGIGLSPVAIAVPSLLPVVLSLGAYALAVAGVVLALGLAVGFATTDRVRGLIGGLLLWVFLLIGYGLLTYAAAQTTWVEQNPGAWVIALLLNPLDAFRVGVLFSLEQVPLTVPGGATWLTTLTSHMGWWMAGVSTLWAAVGLASACRSVRRM